MNPDDITTKEETLQRMRAMRESYRQAVLAHQIKTGQTYELEQIKRLFLECESARNPFMRDSQLNRAYYEGFQYATYDRENRKVNPYGAYDRQDRKKKPLQANYISALLRTQMGILLGGTVHFVVLPGTTNTDDKMFAVDIAKPNLDYWLGPSMIDYESLRIKAQLPKLLDGVVFYKIFWNKGRGKIKPYLMQMPDETGELVDVPTTAEGRPLGEGEKPAYYRVGQADIAIVLMSRLYWPPGITNINDAGYVFQASYRSLAKIRGTWPKTGMAVVTTPKQGDKYEQIWEKKPASTELTGGAVEVEYWEAVTPKRPQGRLIVYAGDVVLYNGPLPYKHLIDGPMRLPFAAEYDIPSDKSVYGRSRVTDCRTLQDTINAGITRVSAWTHHCENPGWVYPLGALANQPKNVPGENVIYNPVFRPPERLKPSSPPLTTINNVKQAIEMMHDVWGIHRSAQGAVPEGAGRMSGIALSGLAGRDDKDLIAAGLSAATAARVCIMQLLGLLHQFQEPGDIAVIVGENKMTQSLVWKQGRSPRGCDIIVSPVIGDSREFKTAQMQMLIQSGIFQLPIEHQRLIFKMLEVQSADELMEDVMSQETLAQKELLIMRGKAEGAPVDVTPQPWHDHRVHSKVDMKYLCSEEAQLEPRAKALVVAHMGEHQVLANTAMLNQQMFEKGQLTQGIMSESRKEVEEEQEAALGESEAARVAEGELTNAVQE